MSEPANLLLITGGTRGLGREITLCAAASGWDVIALYNNDNAAAERLVKCCADFSGRVFCLRHDASQPNFPKLPPAKRLAFIHAAAAPFRPTPLHLLNQEDIETQWRVAVLGFINGLNAVLRPMVRAKEGTVVSILTAALGGELPKGFGAYTSAKLALQGLTQTVTSEYGTHGIRALCFHPGFMTTNFSAIWDEQLCLAVAAAQGGAQDPCQVAKDIWRLVLPTASSSGSHHTSEVFSVER